VGRYEVNWIRDLGLIEGLVVEPAVQGLFWTNHVAVFLGDGGVNIQVVRLAFTHSHAARVRTSKFRDRLELPNRGEINPGKEISI